MKIKKGDTVKVMIGKDRSKSGLVECVFRDSNKVVVKSIHILKKHLKPSQKNPRGGIIDINKSLSLSNVMLICPGCGKPTRAEYKIVKNEKIRICKKCNTSIEERKR